jgi:uncharacterized membrane protein
MKRERPNQYGRRRKGRCALFAAVFAIAALPAIAPQIVFAQCSYSAVVIEGPPCPFAGQAALIGRGLNSHGDVVGFWMDCDVTTNHAFHWSAKTGVLTTLLRPPGVYDTRAEDITDDGLIIGTHSITGLGNRGFVYDINNPDAGFTYLEPLHGVGGSVLRAINNMGLAVGERSIHKPGQPSAYNAVVWNTKTGEVIDLGVMKGPNSGSRALNDTGTSVVGWTGNGGDVAIPFRRDADGNLTFLDGSFGLDLGFPSAVTDADEIVGSAIFDGQLARAFLWKDDDLMLIEPLKGYTASGAWAANNVGQILGRCTSGPAMQTPILWQHGVVHDLAPLVTKGEAVILREPIGINDGGQIATRAIHNGRTVAVLLTPIDRPLTDLNADCVTDVHDLLMLLSVWGPCDGTACQADFNGDGRVDVLDLLILLDNWDTPRKDAPR